MHLLVLQKFAPLARDFTSWAASFMSSLKTRQVHNLRPSLIKNHIDLASGGSRDDVRMMANRMPSCGLEYNLHRWSRQKPNRGERSSIWLQGEYPDARPTISPASDVLCRDRSHLYSISTSPTWIWPIEICGECACASLQASHYWRYKLFIPYLNVLPCDLAQGNELENMSWECQKSVGRRHMIVDDH